MAHPEIASPAGDPALRRIALVLRRSTPWLLAISVVVGGLVYLTKSSETELFRADSSIELTGDVAEGISGSGQRRGDARVEIEAQRRLLESGTLLATLRSELGVADSVLRKVATSNPELTPVIVVGVESDTVEIAVEATDKLIELYIAQRAEEEVARLEDELVPLREQRIEQETLVQSIVDDLAIARVTGTEDDVNVLANRGASALDRLDSYNIAIQEREFRQRTVDPPVRVVESASNPTSSGSSSLTTAIQFALLAFLLSAGIAIAASRIRGRLHLLDEVRAVVGPNVPILATVPKFRRDFRDVENALVVGAEGAQREAESFRYARSAIEVAADGKSPLSILITSSSANEGKTVTSSNLALASANSGRSTVLLDGDLLNASITRVFDKPDMQSAFGALLSKTIDPVKEGAYRYEEGGASLDLLLVPRDEEVEEEQEQEKQEQEQDQEEEEQQQQSAPPRQELSVDNVGDVFRKLKKSWDVVVVDGPPVLAVSDSMVLARSADITVLIVRMSKTTRRDLDTAMTQLRQGGVTVAGVIVSHARERGESYYGYGYQYEAKKS